ncbi:tetratricopeptide repeat protein [Rubinisphaera margarita]|uniref:tetratricopeptide repeat protein n=1 Tax=Rubinisphaera margarita TaxID=2909586 RepID=UPI001EE98F2F|nr:tetratricopeptide repeat protein [Rubinisphaera margarita]MCG6158248.1 tetratricopeptide repeat protein [Rubinisphaera margarita]
MKRRLLRIGLLVATLVVIGVVSWGPWCLQQARESIRMHDLVAAESWLQRSSVIPWTSAERTFLRARIARKLGKNREFGRYIEAARLQGIDEERLDLERMLQRAQLGDLEPLDEQFPQLLQRGEDLSAICEAYVLGLMMQFRIDQAIQVIELWKADFPDDPQPHFLEGRLLEYQTYLDGASIALKRAVDRAPHHVPALVGLARVEADQQNYEAAIGWYQQAAGLMEEPQPALVGMARCYRDQGELAEARKVLERALARPKDDLVDAYRFVGARGETALSQAPIEMAKLELAENHPEDALAWFEQALVADPRDWKTRFLYGQTLQRTGKVDQAAGHLAQAEAARNAFERGDVLIDAVREDPSNVEARYEMGLILMEHMSENNGLVWLKSVLQYDPHHVKTHQKLAEYFTTHMGENSEYARLAAFHAEQARQGEAK